MNNLNFISYEPTPTEKHLGVATINYLGKIILRYKIIPMKNGSGFFPAPASVKIGEEYKSAFAIDSLHEKEAIESFVKQRVLAIIAGKVPQQQQAPQQQYKAPQPQQMAFAEPPYSQGGSDWQNPPF